MSEPQKSYAEPASLLHKWQFWIILIAILAAAFALVYYGMDRSEEVARPLQTNAVQNP